MVLLMKYFDYFKFSSNWEYHSINWKHRILHQMCCLCVFHTCTDGMHLHFTPDLNTIWRYLCFTYIFRFSTLNFHFILKENIILLPYYICVIFLVTFQITWYMKVVHLWTLSFYWHWYIPENPWFTCSLRHIRVPP